MKLPFLPALCAALLVASAGTRAQDGPDDGTAKRTFGNGVLPEYLAIYDVDDNGALSVEEAQILRTDRNRGERLETFRRKWDTNKDGVISEKEREAAKAAIRQLIIERRCRRFDEVDSNADGFLSGTEFRQISAVQSVDSNSPGLAADLFNHLDKDSDQQVSKEEFLRSLDAAPAPTPGEVPDDRPDSIRDSP